MRTVKKTSLALLTALFFLLTATAQGEFVTTTDPRVNEWLNLKTFGAIGDGAANDAPALQAALDALILAGGGTLFVPPGKYRIATTVSANFLNTASVVIVKGAGSASQLFIATGESANALELRNAESLLIDNLVFVGDPLATNDARIVLDIESGLRAMIRNTSFYGLISQVAGGAVLRAENTDLRIEHSAFRGCSGASGLGVPVIKVDNWRGLSVADVDFLDFGVLNGVFHSKTPMNPANAWIQINNTALLDNATAQSEIVIERVRMDEGAFNGVFVNIDPAESDRLAHLRISGLRLNGTGLGGNGVWVQNAERVTIESSWFGYAANPGTAIALINVDNGTIRDVRAEAAFNRIHADSACKSLTVVDSTYGVLDSQATVTSIVRDGKIGVGRDPAQAVDVAGSVRASGQLISTAPQGSAPIAVSSSTVVANLNADKLDGKDASEFAPFVHTHPFPNDVDGAVRIRRDLLLHGTRNFALELGRGQAIGFAGANEVSGSNYVGVLGQVGAFNGYHFNGDLLGSKMEFYNTSEWFKSGIKFYTSTDSTANSIERMRIDQNGNVSIFGSLTKGSGTFLIDHPLYPEKKLYHGFVEAPRYDLIYRGRAKLAKGAATVSIDRESNMSEGTFAALTQNAQVFVYNETGWTPVRAVIERGKLRITSRNRGSRDTVGWLVVAERNDKFIKSVDNVDAAGRLVPEHQKLTAEGLR